MEKLLEQYFVKEANPIFENIGVFAVVDRNGNYIFVSDAWKRMAKCENTDVIGMNVRRFYPNTGCMEAMDSRMPIIGRPVVCAAEGSTHQYTSYYPIEIKGKIHGCVILTFFKNTEELNQFSEEIQKVRQELNLYQNELRELRRTKYSIDNIIGESEGIVRVRQQIRLAANSMSNVLIEGETGTGKELVAQAIHDLGSRSYKPLIKLNCAAIPEGLAESELFGYEKGAFTGANKNGKPGKFELANGGTLFLDEINQLSTTIQPKLLRAIQEREIERVGGVKTIPVAVRLIAATNTPLEEMINEGKFRDDLYYRLNVINIKIPPLRERLDDIALLSNEIIDSLNVQMGTRVNGITEESLKKLQEYSWPGNVRELQNVIERIMNEKISGTISWRDVEPFYEMLMARDGKRGAVIHNISVGAAKRLTEKRMIIEALKKCDGNKKKTAELLGISRPGLYKKLKELGLE